jgi:beta-galactosidase/beta-glucuronidase
MIEFPLRPRIDLCSDWEFVRGKVNRGWLSGRGPCGEPVDLPHCWNLDDTYQYDRKSYQGFGGYRREFHVPKVATGGTWYLCAGGFYGIGDAWLDGRRLDRFDGQYLGFEIPLPPTLDHGPHVIAVRLENRFHRNVLPGKKDPDFLLYGGLTGGVWIEQRPWPRLDIRSTVIACTPNPDESEKVEVQTFVSSPHGASADAHIHWTITDQGGTPVARTEAARASGLTATVATVAEPRCWSPEHPDLYWAEGRVENDSGVIDVIRVRFGITRAEFRSREGFFLDGRPTELHGVNRHESIPGLGSALPTEIHRSDTKLLKQYGCNMVRLSHYPQAPAFLDACDEIGIMAYSELASWKSVRSSRGWRRAARRQFGDLIVRDRHHASVIVWGMGNESRSRKTYLELRRIARDLDPARPVTYAENHLYRARRQKTTGIPDVWSTNYELEVLEPARDSSRLEIVFVSECCNHPKSIKGDECEELEQIRVIEAEWTAMSGIDGLAGHTVWSFCDYATEHRERYRRQNGLFDAWRRPKMAAELFRARYADDAFVALFLVEAAPAGDRSPFCTVHQRSGEPAPDRWLHVFSNCEKIEVHQAGSPVILLEGGIHSVVGIARDRGRIEARGFLRGRSMTTVCDPWGTAAEIVLSPSRSVLQPGTTGAIEVAVTDADGRRVDDWNGLVTLSATGSVELSCFNPENTVVIARGEGRVYARRHPSGGEATIMATADGIAPGSLTLSDAVSAE